MRIDVKEYVKEQKDYLKTTCPKKLLIIQVGNNVASNKYVQGKIKDCEEVGYRATLIKYPELVPASTIYTYLKTFGASYDGIILQEPANIYETSTSYSTQDIIDLIDPKQDVDGFKVNSKHKPCTPLGIINFLHRYYGKLEGSVITVVGKGKLVGAPLVPMLMKEGATVINCNSKTADLASMTQLADIVVTCTGHPRLITKNMLSEGAIVIDAGIAFDENNKMCGDCDPALYDDKDVFVTTVPGGVGLLTRVTLLQNLNNTAWSPNI
ncbi:MAG: bifunctional 5,10-methylenetetrahydrofolate dehydrogenase/5,10-methenyltetrahydrofolate cyclohydrolase [Ruminococcus sp.]|nr:bifunctional 5,10-methylenetetrahydrofolate dehydrogenase/5,10-methenyltetrahydrofolate cyclohydrolase [Ruminococcus sp.]